MKLKEVGVARAFAGLGLLIGLVTGLSASSVVASLLGLLFALMGGSLIVFFRKMEEEQLALAYKAMFALSTACIVGVVVGIVIGEWQVLSPRASGISSEARDTIESRKYLRDHVISKARAIDVSKRQGEINAEEAYEELRALIVDEEGRK